MFAMRNYKITVTWTNGTAHPTEFHHVARDIRELGQAVNDELNKQRETTQNNYWWIATLNGGPAPIFRNGHRCGTIEISHPHPIHGRAYAPLGAVKHWPITT